MVNNTIMKEINAMKIKNRVHGIFSGFCKHNILKVLWVDCSLTSHKIEDV